MDLIFIDSLVFSGTHGVHKHEKKEQQRFSVDITVETDTRRACKSDSIKDAVDYGPLRDIVRQVIENESHDLIETIADRISSQILTDRRIKTVRTTIHKLDIWGNGTPGISITRPYGKNILNFEHPKSNKVNTYN